MSQGEHEHVWEWVVGSAWFACACGSRCPAAPDTSKVEKPYFVVEDPASTARIRERFGGSKP